MWYEHDVSDDEQETASADETQEASAAQEEVSPEEDAGATSEQD